MWKSLLVHINLLVQEAEEPGIEGAGLEGDDQLGTNHCNKAKSL